MAVDWLRYGLWLLFLSALVRPGQVCLCLPGARQRQDLTPLGAAWAA